MTAAITTGLIRLQRDARASTPPSDPAVLATRLLSDNSQRGRRDLSELKRDLDALALRDPSLGQAVRREVDARLSPVERGQLARATYGVRLTDGTALTVSPNAMPVADKFRQPAGSPERQAYDRLDRIWGDGNARTDDTAAIETGVRDMLARGLSLAQVEAERAAPTQGPSVATQIADLTQLALDLTGIVDQSGLSDGANAAISAGRAVGAAVSGDFGEAGGHLGNGLLSAIGIVPLIGDAAKLGKLGKWAQTVSDAVATATRNPAARAALEPMLHEIHRAVKAIPQGALDALPKSARESLEGMRGELDGLFGMSARGADDAAGRLARLRGILGDLPLNSSSLDELVKAGRMTVDEARDLAAHVSWKDVDGRWIYPPNDGFLTVARTTLTSGDTVRIDRFGGRVDSAGDFNDRGRFFSPAGSDYSSRALPPGTQAAPFRTYEVTRDLPVDAGPATPWFGERGSGTQYRTDLGVQDLIRAGYLREVK